jgi:uncharacterized phage protein gp47/JayE
MPNVSKSTVQIANNLTADYVASATDPITGAVPDTSPGTVNRDLIDTTAAMLSAAYSAIETTREMSSLQNAALMTTDAMSQIGLNFELTQAQPTLSTGTIFFQRFTPLTKIVDFPSGTTIQTQPALNGTVTKFITTAAAQLNPSTPLNPANYRYETSVAIIAVVAGSAGNVGPGSINQLATPNRNIDAVINKSATSGGTDLEDNVTFANQILAETAGESFGTSGGTATAILKNFPGVLKTVIAGPGDPAMVRAQYGNEVDAYLLGTSFAAFTDLITVSGGSTDQTLTHPVVSIVSVVGATNAVVYTVNTDVALVKDTSVVYGNSARAFDKIQWLTTHRAGAGQTVNVTGFFDANVTAVQNFLNLQTSRFATEDIVAKAATRIGLVVGAQISAYSGYDHNTLISNVTAAVINGLSNYTMGQNVIQSDIVDIIAAVPGVNEVGIPLTALHPTSAPLPVVNDSITVLKTSYARSDTITITAS